MRLIGVAAIGAALLLVSCGRSKSELANNTQGKTATSGAVTPPNNMPAISKFDAFPQRRRASPSSFLTVQEGCDKFCTYCVVPYTRGAEISRPWGHIVAEAHSLVEGGAREIVLLGQNVNAWTDGERGLAHLIRALAEIDGLERIRYTTSHPMDMPAPTLARGERRSGGRRD